MKNKISDFIPLIIIFIAIFLFTIFMVKTNPGADLMFGMRMFMSGFFLVFGFFKVIKWKNFAIAYQEYDVIAKRSLLYARLYPLIEITLGLFYFFAISLLYTNIFTLIIMLISAYGVWLKLREGEEIMCACLGTVFKFPMTYVTLFEDLLMAIMALWMIILL